ncbi:MAG: hypothetical protein CMM02_05105 [Rhodopirellula sp.]|nr:hypothetical protein [Rhodopirellula sp.]
MQPNEKRRLIEPILHKLADTFTEILIYFIVIFSPWAFGTTETWSIWAMNISAYALGFLLISKLTIRWKLKYKLYVTPEKTGFSSKQKRISSIQKKCNILLAGIMLLLLAYVLTSAINARASFDLIAKEYTYFKEFNVYLPHSYDSIATWKIFWQYLGLIILFWAIRDWLADSFRKKTFFSLNPRLKKLLFIVCINGSALTLECILQRIYFDDNLGKLLFLFEPNINKTNDAQFGPFAYRSNAASYLNLIWPLCIGLFLQLGNENLENKKKRLGKGPELILIPCIILTASGPIISSSRGGALIMLGLVFLTIILFLFSKIKINFLRYAVPIFLMIGLILAYQLGWDSIEPRLEKIFLGNMSSRIQLYQTLMTIINDYGVFGSGPGSFETIIQFEFNESFTRWESWAHNDYLELYLTFGKFSLMLFALPFICIISLFINLKSKVNYHIQSFSLIAIVGLMINALIDFPLQTHSILILLCIICATVTLQEKQISN